MGAIDVGITVEAAFMGALWRRHFAPRQDISIADWCDRWRYVAKGPEKGPWRTARTPYLREPMDCMGPDSPFETVVMQFATQLGKTEVLYNTACHRIDVDPCDMMIVQPTLNDAKQHSRTRWAPTVAKMPCILERLPKTASREASNTWDAKEIDGGASALFFAGANSARSLASKPLALAMCDEIDGYPADVDGEGPPIDLIRERLSNYWNRKLLLCSTPTTKDFSPIEAAYLASDRRRFHVPCPHCGCAQVLVWGADQEYGIKWLKDAQGQPILSSVAYVCRHCGAAIEERAKTDMLEAGTWVPENSGASGGLVAGFQLSKLYSPAGWKSWRSIVNEWTQAIDKSRAGDHTKLKAFVNLTLGETYEDSGDRADQHALQRRAADIPLRQVQPGHYVRTLGVDVQGDRLEAFDWAWGRGMRRQLVDRVVFYGDPALPETEPGSPWAELTTYRRTDILHTSGNPVPLLAVMIDSGGHHTQQVYSYARAHQHANVHAVKGSSQGGRAILGKPTEQDINFRGARIKRGVKLWPIGTDTAKAEIYGRLRITEPGPGFVLFSKHTAPDVFEQITSERLVTRYVKGHPKLEWVKPAGKRNEALDGAVYALAGALWLGMERWREGDWRRWESRAEHTDLFNAPPPAAASAEPAPAPAAEVTAPPPAPKPADPQRFARPRGRFTSNPWRR